MVTDTSTPSTHAQPHPDPVPLVRYSVAGHDATIAGHRPTNSYLVDCTCGYTLRTPALDLATITAMLDRHMDRHTP